MGINGYTGVFHAQKTFFRTNATKDISFRKKHLEKLYSSIKENERKILEALYKDFRKSGFEGYGTEVGLVLSEISFQIKNLRKWSSPHNAGGNILDFKSSAKTIAEPLGQVLIIAPWNYPFQLIMSPLAGAIAAGNTVFLKPSELTPATSAVINQMIQDVFPGEYICCIEGGVNETQALLDLPFNMVFFTGSEKVGKIIMEKASRHLSRVCLELGGKSPCIIDKTAPADLTAKRIVWGKFLNGGQTCVAPDFLFVHKEISPALKEGLKKYIKEFYGSDPATSPDFPRIINSRHFKRIKNLIDPEKVFVGGHCLEEDLYISPTILEKIGKNDPVMQEEIFGPVLPILEFSEMSEITDFLNSLPTPLSLYIFSRNKAFIKKLLRETESGSVNINDVVMQFANKNLPFGGKGASGMGSYHGKASFDCFSHYKSINKKSLFMDLPFRYPPYTGRKLGILRALLK
ncbi:MAG: aldehyde dehydrogenase [Bacteroidales bacterium]|nr:aldehyde dehydrogenase [Bacteroidales bacterium]MCB9000109.1 aldehyde dehydrogenase [Bacteroidales bacterium]